MSTSHTFKLVFVIAPHLSPYQHHSRETLKFLHMSSSSSSAASHTSTKYSSTPTHTSQLDVTDVNYLLGQSVISPQVRSDSGSPPPPTTHAPLLTTHAPSPSASSSTCSLPFASPDHGSYQVLPSSPSHTRSNWSGECSSIYF
jgi:hypothetical protein